MPIIYIYLTSNINTRNIRLPASTIKYIVKTIFNTCLIEPHVPISKQPTKLITHKPIVIRIDQHGREKKTETITGDLYKHIADSRVRDAGEPCL